MLNNFFNLVNLKQESLDMYWERATLISENIANIETPNYKRKDIDFESVLRNKINGKTLDLKLTSDRHITNAFNYDVNTNFDFTSMRQDKNNVNIDLEMANQAKTLIKYNAITSRLDSDIKMMRSIIRGGK